MEYRIGVEGVRGSEGATHERLSGRADILEEDAVTVSFSGDRERGSKRSYAKGEWERASAYDAAVNAGGEWERASGYGAAAQARPARRRRRGGLGCTSGGAGASPASPS
jgi:hypothetical protein